MFAIDFEARPYVLKHERGAETPTVFLIRPLRHSHREAVAETRWNRDEKTGQVMLLSNPFKKARMVLQGGLVGWRALKGAAGEIPFPAPLPGQPLGDEVFDMLGEYVEEIAEAILDLSKPAETDQKNF